jgi:hypothetical protein
MRLRNGRRDSTAIGKSLSRSCRVWVPEPRSHPLKPRTEPAE